jgi:acetoin utilization deacetylase AcuC-like enzyme
LYLPSIDCTLCNSAKSLVVVAVAGAFAERGSMTVGIVKDDIYLQHITDDFHPESPRRLARMYGMLKAIPDQTGLAYISPRMATHEEIGLIHDASYIQAVLDTRGKVQRRLDPDTVTSARSYDAACAAVGGVLDLADQLMGGDVDNGIALVRPPGHHAESGRSMGFCIFNNIAIGARYVQRHHGVKRVLVVDFDLHHGNGTQHSFYDDPSVLYISTHQYPFYPGTGWYDEVGEGDGKGYTINIPMTPGMDDMDYYRVFDDVIRPASRLFRPEVVLVSAGYDIHKNDPMGSMEVTERGFARMTRSLMDIAEEQCDGKLLLALEGGYDIVALTESVKATILELRRTPLYVSGIETDRPNSAITDTISRVKEAHKPFWGAF